MKAVRYEAATQFRIVEVDKPVPEPGEVVIKVAQTGLYERICTCTMATSTRCSR